MSQQPPFPPPPEDEPRYGVRLPPGQQPVPPQQPAWGTESGQPGQNPYGQPQGGQPPYGQTQGGQPPYGQAQGGQPPYGQPQGGQPPYGQNPYGQAPGGLPYSPAPDPYGTGGYGQASSTSKNNLGVWALVCGIGGLLCNPALIAGVILGVLARKAVREGTANNGGMATAGLVISIIGCVLWVISLVYLSSIGYFDAIWG